MKKRAFTIVELLISISILSIALIMSSLVFSHAVRQPKQLQSKVISSSDAVSKMENKINEVKQDKDIATQQEGILRFGTVTGKIEGVYLSYDGTKIKTNDVTSEDELITFVGKGYESPLIPNMKNIYLNNSTKFIYLPIGSEISDAKISATCNAEIPSDEIKKYLKKIRLRFLKSSLQSRYAGYFNFPYIDDKGDYLNQGYTDKSGFGYIGITLDSEDKAISFNGNYEIPIYKNKKQEYLDSIDRDYIAEAMTLNTNGYTSPAISTLNDSLNSAEEIQRCVRVIGLPYTNNLSAFYDCNLLLAKTKNTNSADKNKYYPIYNISQAADTNFQNIVTQTSDKYELNWHNFDIRNFINDNTSNKVDKISLNPAFLNKIKLFSDEHPSSIDFPNIKKIYGNTVFYNLQKPVAEFNVPKDKNYTLFVKFNIRQFDVSKKNAPISLLSYNLNSDGNLIDTASGGFTIYADNNGIFHINTVTPTLTSNRNLGINISDSALYHSGNFKFENLGNSKEKNSREDFNIIGITINPISDGINIKMDMLKKKEVENNSKHKLETQIQTIFNDKIQISVKDDIKYFLISDINKVNSVPLESSDDDTTIELSDLLLYSEDLGVKKFGTSDYRNLTMDYLYRKYLTERERHEGGFDQFFMTKY